MLGSRLYFRLVREVLADDARYEAVMDDVVQEVRRRAPSASAGRVITAGGAQVPRPARQTAPAAARAVKPSTAAGGASVALTVHSTSINNNSNCGNTDNSTLILM